MSLFSFYKKIKEDPAEAIRKTLNKGRQTYDNYQNAKNTIKGGLDRFVSSWKEAPQNLKWGLSQDAPKWAQKIPDANESIGKWMAEAPRFNFAQKIKNPVGRFAATIPQETLNIPSKLVQNVGRTGRDISSGRINTFEGRKQFLGRTGENALDVATLGRGKALVGAGRSAFEKGLPFVAKQFKKGAIQGAKSGAPIGAGYGASLVAQEEGTRGGDIAKGAGTGLVFGGVLGGGLGGSLSGGGSLSKAFQRDRKIGGLQNTKDTLNVLAKNTPRPGMTIEDVSRKEIGRETPPVLPSRETPLALPRGVRQAPLNVLKEGKRPLFATEEGIISSSRNKARLEGDVKKIGDEDFKDIGSPAVGFRDVYRNFERFFRDKAPEMSEKFLLPFEKSKKTMYDNLSRHAQNLEKNIVKGLGIKPKSKESALVQNLGEGNITFEDVVRQVGKEKAEKIAQADKWFRAQYNREIDEINRVRAQIYPNDPTKLIQKRKDYYRHFQERREGLGEGFAQIFETPAGIDNTLAGISGKTKPFSRFLSFAQKRLGNKTDEDAVGGFINYVLSAEYAKNIDPHLRSFRNLREALAQQGNKRGLNYNNFLTFLDKFADDLAGKTNTLDRGVQELTGRKVFQGLDLINRRVKANTILGNASSSMAQIFAVPKGIAMAGEKNYAKGIKMALEGLNNPKKNISSQSPFLQERYFRDFNKFQTGILKNPKKVASFMINALDEVGTKANWNAFYSKAVSEGIKNPIRYADDMARKMIGGRGIGEVPIAQKSKIFQVLAPFTLEVVNDWYVWAELAKKGGVPLLKGAMYTFVFNQAVEKIRGSDVAFDPINALWEGLENSQKEEGIKDKALVIGGRLGGEVLSNVPLGTTLASAYPEYGRKNEEGETVLPPRDVFFGQGDPTRFGGGLLATRALSDPLYNLALPFGGQQVKRTIQGLQSVNRGYGQTGGGNVTHPIEQNLRNYIQGGIFGRHSLPEAQTYREEEGRPLGKSQSEIFKNTGGANYESVQQERATQEMVKRLKEEGSIPQKESGIFGMLPQWMKTSAGAQTGGIPPESGIVELPNGKFYSQELEKTFDNYDKAILEKTKYDFENSDEDFRELENSVLYKDWEGKAKVQDKQEYTGDLLGKQMTLSKNQENFGAYMEAGEKRMEILQNLYEREKSPLKKLDIENQILNLQDNLEKYASYGGFKKPKAGGGASSGLSLMDKQLAQFKIQGDLKGYLQTAYAQAEALQSAIEGEADPEKRLSLENKLLSLKENVGKYRAFKGFTQPKQEGPKVKNVPLSYANSPSHIASGMRTRGARGFSMPQMPSSGGTATRMSPVQRRRLRMAATS